MSLRMKLRNVAGKDIAMAGIVGLDRFGDTGEHDPFELHIVGVEIIREVKFRRCPALHAYLHIIQFECRRRVA